MKEIKLTNTDKVVLVDDCDYPYVSMFDWMIHHGYAIRYETFDDETKTIHLHRFIWYLHNGVPEDKYLVDHIDRNRLNDRLENLRLATKAENAKNRSKQSNNTSGFRGVTFEKYFDEQKNKNYEYWKAQWYDENGKNKHKRFDPTDEGKILAARFMDKVLLKQNGEFAGHLNFPNNILSDEEFEKLLEKKDMSGENNPFYGKHHTEESKKKMSKKVCIKEINKIFNSLTECAKFLNVDCSAICNAIKRNSKVKRKYTIEYI